MRIQNSPRMLWVDAICINQQSISERNEQVSQMRYVYQSAKRVCIWLGDDDPLTRRGMEFIDQIHDFFPGVQIRIEPDDSKGKIYYNGLPIQKGFLPLRDGIEADFYRLYLAYTWIEDLSWRSRAWVVQGFAMAKEAIFGCGGRWIPWSNFELWGLLDDTARSKPYRHGTRLGAFAKIRLMQQEGTPLFLLRLLQETIGFDATDPRDKIYAVLGLASKAERDAIPHDSESIFPFRWFRFSL